MALNTQHLVHCAWKHRQYRLDSLLMVMLMLLLLLLQGQSASGAGP
jgi:heme A synthase